MHGSVIGILVGRLGPGLGRIRRSGSFQILGEERFPAGRVSSSFRRGDQEVEPFVGIAGVVGSNRFGIGDRRRGAAGACGLFKACVGQLQAMRVAYASQLQQLRIRKYFFGVQRLPDLICRARRVSVASQQIDIQRKRSWLEWAGRLNLLDQCKQLLPSVLAELGGITPDDYGGFGGNPYVVGGHL